VRRSIARDVRLLYRAAFNGETLPPRWRVFFVDKVLLERHGRIQYGTVGAYWRVCRLIEVERPATHHGWLHTLIHEFIHQRCPGLRHGAEFERLIDAALERMWQH